MIDEKIAAISDKRDRLLNSIDSLDCDESLKQELKEVVLRSYNSEFAEVMQLVSVGFSTACHW